MKKRIARSVVLAALATLVVVVPVLAYNFYAPFVVAESDGNDYAMFPSMVTTNVQWMVDNSFMLASGLDTRVQSAGGAELPHLVVDDRVLAAVPLPADTQLNYLFTTGDAPLASMPVITGWNGYATITDAAGLEPANNFLFEFEDAYTDISLTTNAGLMVKDQAFGTAISQGNTIFSWIWAVNGIANSGAGGNNSPVWGNTWVGQSFTTGAAVAVTRVTLTLAAGAGAPAGDFTVSIRNTTGGIPSGTDLASVTVNANTLGVGANNFDLEIAYPLLGATMYSVIVRHPSGDAGNFWNWTFNNANPYGGGTYLSSADGDVTWVSTPAFDTTFSVTGTSWFVESAAVTGAEHDVDVEANPGANTFGITIDGGAPVTIVLGAATVPNNANDWILNVNNGVPYFTHYRHTVAGALVTRYEPNTMILGTTLPDREAAANDAVFTWGSSPSGVTVTLGSLVAVSQPSAGDIVDDPTLDILPVAPASDWFQEPAVAGALLTNPLRPLVTIMSDTTNLSERQAWIWMGSAFVLLVLAATAKVVRGHHIITGVATGAAIGLLVAMTVFPLWALVFIISAIAVGAVAERSPSL